MSIPQFTADASLAEILGQPRYARFMTTGVPGGQISPQTATFSRSGRLFGFDQCFVSCIQRSGGSASAIIQNCTAICMHNPIVVF
jgi:hypothetical protein